MNIFKNKFLVKLIATICLFLALISFGTPTKVYAKDTEWGGVLITPIVNLLTALGDGIMELLHSSVQSQKVAMIKIDGSKDWTNILAFFGAALVAILVAVITIKFVVLTGGAASWVVSQLGLSIKFGTTISLGLLATAGVAGTLSGIAIYKEWIPEDIYLPAFSVTAEEIFSNEILLFDINFFDIDESKPETYSEEIETGSVSIEENYDVYIKVYYGKFDSVTAMEGELTEEELSDFDIILGPEQISGNGTYYYSLLIEDVLKKYATGGTRPSIQNLEEDMQDNTEGAGQIQAFDTILSKANGVLGTTPIKKENQVYTGVEQEGEKKIGWLGTTVGTEETGPKHVVIFLEVTDTETASTVIEKVTVFSTAYRLHNIIAKWYFILRNIAILVLMIVLVYTGIRIVLASTAGEKAKYKERIIDWIVAMCLLFVMHYIMVFAVNIVDKITDLVQQAGGTNGNYTYINLTDEQAKNAKMIFEEEAYGKMLAEKGIANLSNGGKTLTWISDLTGLFRIQSQLTDEGTSKWVGYSFGYVVLVAFTCFFAWTYLKRIVYMAFLTMIAPLVAMTYPIDKITDGKAQAFNSWLKEYIFNLLIQPMHLLLYTILVSSAYELASESAIYALVALGFMLPAEKLMRKFFGFEKASTPGLLGGAAGAALAMTGINKFLGHRPKGGHSGGKDSGGNESKDSVKMNYKTSGAISGMKGIAGEPTEEARTSTSSSKIDTRELEDDKTPDKIDVANGKNPHHDSHYEHDNPIVNEEQEKTTNYEYEQKQRNQNEWDKFIKERKINQNKTLQDKWKERRAEKKQDRKDNFDSFLSKHSTMKEAYDGMQNIATGFAYNHPYLASHIKGTQAATGAYYRALGKRIGNKIQNGHPIRAMARGAAGLAGAATFGAAGLAMGVVTGDPSKAFQYGSAGVLGGSKFASSAAGAAMKATSVDQEYLQEQHDLAAHGDEYKNYMIEQEKKRMQESEKYINYLQKTMSLSRAQAQNVLKTTGSECFDSGITNVEDIATIHKMLQLKDPETNQNYTIGQAIGAKKFNDLLPSDVSKMSQKKKDDYIATWRKDYEDSGYGAKSKDYAKKSMELAIKFSNTQSSLKKSQV